MTYRARTAFTITEALIAVTILAILLTAAIPRIRQASEQMRLDAAALRLRAVWSAQRVHWLEHGEFAMSSAALFEAGLIDAELGAGFDGSWTYSFGSPTPGTFVATASRDSGGWAGTLEIDETGTLIGGMKTPGGAYLTSPDH